MNQASQPAVQPRRNVLTALWVWIVAVWGATELFASSSKTTKTLARHPELTMLLGRLCLDPDFRADFFKADSDQMAITKAGAKGIHVSRKDAVEAVGHMRGAHKSPNAVQDACKGVSDALQACGMKIPCPDWPC